MFKLSNFGMVLKITKFIYEGPGFPRAFINEFC